ncbi:hypothetical protein [Lichenihabitans psoromatis]|uniref:hypothetical protein n=1 Tax=Lichenihabitans psoromatis TaxID=2528642 RepID=UPI001035C81D|nr:hypothetical protein [Lichenihabitans psoromatis]
MTATLHALPSRNSRGELLVYPCEDAGGSWAIDHVSRTGRTYRIGEWLALDAAIKAAKAAAAKLGADFIEGVTL